MQELTQRLAAAKQDSGEMNNLIAAYMPFIKREVSRTPVFDMDYDDRLSIAMVVFMSCARQYDAERGAFLPFAAACIRNRLIDEGKKQGRHRERVILLRSEQHASDMDTDLSMQEYGVLHEKARLREEIESLETELALFGITLWELPDICPKQKRSRELCVRVARGAVRDETIKAGLMDKKVLPRALLAERFGISEKTLEKHRKFIVSVAVILSGDYPGVGAFLPDIKEVE